MSRERQLFQIVPVCIILLLCFGCASTRYEEYGPPVDDVGNTSVGSTELLITTQQQVRDLEVRLASLEAAVGSLVGLESAQADLQTRMMSLSEQLEALRRQLSKTETATPKPSIPTRTVQKQDIDQIYGQGLEDYYARRFEDAKISFMDVLNLDPGGEWADNAQYWIGECDYASGNYDGALVSFQKVFTFSNTEKDDDAQLMLGQCYLQLGNYDNALIELNRLKIDFPKSEYIRRAEEHIRAIRSRQDTGP